MPAGGTMMFMSPSSSRNRIDSPKNPHVKALMRLSSRRERDATGLTLVEGQREVLRAIEADMVIREVMLEPGAAGGEGERLARVAEQRGSQLTELSPAAFERLSVRQHPDGVLAVMEIPKRNLASLKISSDALILVASATEKPGNLGALFRSADATRTDAILVSDDLDTSGTDVWNPNVIRASMGSVFHVPSLTAPSDAFLAFLRTEGVRIVTAEPSATTRFWDANLQGRVAIVVGSEHAGVPPAWSEAASDRISIPMHGAADSLNVSVSGALLLYEALRQRS